MQKFIMSFILANSICALLIAQPPQAFKYQVVVRDGSGDLINNQSVAFSLSILDGGSSGTLIYNEVQTVTTNQFGLASLSVGAGIATTSTFENIDWGSGSKFLKVECDPSGGNTFTYLGSSQLLSVPYALYSNRSGDWIRNGDQLYSSNSGFVGIGTTSPSAKLDVAGEAETGISVSSSGSYGIWSKSDTPSAAAILGEGLTSDSWGVYGYNQYGGIAVRGYSDGGWAGHFDGNLYVSENVGIGTTSPSAKLDVAGGSGTGISVSSNSSFGIWSKSDTPSAAAILGEAQSSETWGVYGYNQFGGIAVRGYSAGGWAGYFDGNLYVSGNVGIGTSNPGAKLHVNKKIRIGEDPSYPTVYGEIIHEGGGSGFIINSNAGGGTWADLYFQTNGTTKMFIESGGNVGIGTTAPTTTLDVNGGGRFRSLTTGTVANAVYQKSDGTLITGSSDVRLKDNIEPLTESLEKVKQLQGVSFTWKENPEQGRSIGFIAQDFEKVVPELAFTNQTDGYKGINYAEVTALLVEAIKEQQKIIETLQVKISKLENN